jgi:ATP-binding cassette subfamily F protein uup
MDADEIPLYICIPKLSYVINYILVENASKSFGDITLLHDITFGLDKGRKVALIARNGAGKTTLLNILAGKDSFDSGSYYIRKDIKTGYLEQDPKFDPALTLFQAVYGASGILMETVREFELAMHHHDQQKLQEASANMDFHNAWDMDARIKVMLGVLKLDDGEQLVGSLSGGQVKRLALAVTLINEPDLLVLDEPTNHLDVDMIEWLEEYLSKSQVTLLMVTHDRYFLDRVCNEIIELDEKSAYTYKGNYSRFLTLREERVTTQSQKAARAQNLLRNELEWMRRMPKARTHKAKYRIDAFYDLKRQSEYRRDDSRVEVNIQTTRLGKKILVLDKVSKRFGETTILDKFSYTFLRREKLGIIGRNGTGKTTFLNMITGQLKADSGRIEQGETVVYGYYRQQGLEFKPGQRVIEVLKEIAEEVTQTDGRPLSVSQFLNLFLFPPEMQYVYVDKLSGGEKRRLYLMTVLMRNPNFLVLDEPTNDFDIVTLNVLEEFLAGFGGCLVIVSHDRFFMDKLVDHLFIFEGDGTVYDFPGNYSDYRESARQDEIESRRNDKGAGKKTASLVPETQEGPKKKKLSFSEKKEYESLAADIGLLEKEKGELEASLNKVTMDHQALLGLTSRIAEIAGLIDLKINRWMELGERM